MALARIGFRPVSAGVLLLLSCAPSGDSGSPESTQASSDAATAEARSRASRLTSFCDRATDCPEGLATIAIANGNDVTLCTGFLMDRDRVRTSRECVPEAYRRAADPASCRGSVFIAFPESLELRGSTSGCADLIDPDIEERQGSNQNSRWITFQLETRSSLETLNTLPAVPERGQDLIVYRSEKIPMNSRLSARIVQRRCRLAERTPIGRNGNAMHIALGCASNPSSRGSPLLDRFGNVRGTLEWGLTETDWNSLLETRRSIYRFESLPASFISLFACEIDSSRRSQDCRL